MIVKHIHMETVRKSDFAELVEYMTDPQNKHERVGTISVTNCQSEQANIAMLEVLNTQIQNKRSEADKTYHLMVSFRHGELPDEATLKAIEVRICATLGFAEHQRISAAHHDTDNVHMHIAINKIHPTRYTINEPYNAYYTLAKLCDKLENDYGLEKDNHTPTKGRGENRAADMERHSDVESLLSWIKRECQEQIRDAQSWSSLHQVMREHGLEIREHANGLIFSAENGISVKASSVHREFSKKHLEGRLGSFAKLPTPAMGTPKKHYEKKPIRSKVNTVELNAKYKQAQQSTSSISALECAKAIVRKQRLIENAKRTGRLKRAAIKISGLPGIGKKLMYASTSKTLREDVAAINKAYMKERQEIYETYQRMAWADWLRKEATMGNQEALGALRARENSTGLRGNTVAGKGSQKTRTTLSNHDSITKRGTIIYKFGASAVRDDGDKLNVSRGADQTGLLAALTMAMERYGERITVNGSSLFKEQIVQIAAAANLPINFNDEALERRRQQLSQTPNTEEKTHGYTNSKDRGRIDRRRNGSAGRAAASRAAHAARTSAVIPTSIRHTNGVKPYIGKVGAAPPPKSRNHMRNMSKLDMVQLSDRSAVLLQGNVPDYMEHQAAKPNLHVRRDIRGAEQIVAMTAITAAAIRPAPIHGAKPNIGRAGSMPPHASKGRLRCLSQLGALCQLGEIVIGERTVPPVPPVLVQLKQQAIEKIATVQRHIVSVDKHTPGAAAAHKYIAERQLKRLILFDIPNYIHYRCSSDGAAIFAGIRQVEGQALALLKQGDDIMVLPIDDATARRLKRTAVGEAVTTTPKGAIKTKGRSR